MHTHSGHTKRRWNDGTARSVIRPMGGYRASLISYGRCHPVVCPIVLTSNQNINTVVDIHMTPFQYS